MIAEAWIGSSALSHSTQVPLTLDKDISESLARVVDAAGTSEFYPELCAFLSRDIDWNARMILKYSKEAKPAYLWTDKVSQYDINLYLNRFYRLDPFFAFWRKNDGPAVMRMSASSDFLYQSSAYFRLFQPMVGSKDGLAVFLPVHGGAAMAVCFESRELYSERVVETLNGALPLLVALNTSHQRTVMRGLLDRSDGLDHMVGAMAIFAMDGSLLRANHEWRECAASTPQLEQALDLFEGDEPHAEVALEFGILKRTPLSDHVEIGPDGYVLSFEPGAAKPPVSLAQMSQEFLADELTAREREIVTMIIEGASSQDIADALGVSEGTIKNHRKRLYKKLAINSERELLARFIRYFSTFL